MATTAAALTGFTPRAHARHRLAARVALSALVVAVLGPLAVMNLAAAMDPSSTGGGQGFAQERSIVASSSGALSFDAAAPGATATEYVTVRTPVSSPGVELSATVTGTGLDRSIQIRIVRGSGRGTAFSPDVTDHSDLGRGVLYEGTLAGLGTTTLADPSASWARDEEHTYRIVGTLDDSNAAQGLTASVDLAWATRPD
ncbi:MAG: hypothetical protein WEA10_05555 [Actinomycetota bacterium]